MMDDIGNELVLISSAVQERERESGLLILSGKSDNDVLNQHAI